MLLVAHGLSAGAQYFLIGIAERYTGTRELDKMGGLASKIPVFSTLFGFAAVMALAVPGSAGFVGEFNILMALWVVHPSLALVGGLCMILSAAYMLRFVQKVIFGKSESQFVEGKSMTALEGSSIGILVALLLAFGIHPAAVTSNAYEILSEETVVKMDVKAAQEASADKGETSEEAASSAEEDMSQPGEDGEVISVPQTEEEIAQLKTNLKANGFSDEEIASLVEQMKAMSAEGGN